MRALQRPPLRYRGGKWRLAPWIISHLPAHRTYVEPFGGGASVLMRKGRTYAEVYNDLDGEVVNVFRVLRHRYQAEALAEALRRTPFSREDFEAAYNDEETDDPVERARRTVVKSFMGFGSAAIHDHRPRGMRTPTSAWRTPTGFRSNSERSGTTAAHDWASYPEHLVSFYHRLRGVVIENRDALDVIAQHDGPDTLHYIDPPYVHATRNGKRTGRGKGYSHEMDDEAHRALAELLRSVEGMVVVSGYPGDLYDRDLYPDWKRLEREHLADGAARRREVLWINRRGECLELFA